MDDANAVVAAAIAGVGIAWAPRWLVADALLSGALVAILEAWAGKPSIISILRRKTGQDPDRVTRVIAFLKANSRGSGCR